MTECYIVAVRRVDGSLPKPGKAYDGQVYFSLVEARNVLHTYLQNYPESCIYRCHIEVVEEVG